MIFDNQKCLETAEGLVEQFSGKSRLELKKQIAGELNRYFALGKFSAIQHFDKALRNAEKETPR